MGFNALAAVWGGVAWVRRVPATSFWPVLRVAQATVALEVLAGVVLWLGGTEPPDSLHYLYGIAPLVVTLFAEGMRVGAAQREVAEVDGPLDDLPRREQVLLARRIVLREIGVMTIGTLLVVTLMLRATGSVL